jgi:predicted nucleic acid-binding protein
VSKLADTSAWVWSRRATQTALRRAFDTALVDGEVATCDMVRLELLYSARSAGEFAELREELAAMPDCPIGKEQWERALWVYQQLSAQGGAHQRAVKHADLLIAAAAEGAVVTVLHYDEDYDGIAAITGQATRWLAEKGSSDRPVTLRHARSARNGPLAAPDRAGPPAEAAA